MFTTPTCMKGCGSISDRATYPPRMFMRPKHGMGTGAVSATEGLSRDITVCEGDKKSGSTPTCFAAAFIPPYRQSSGWNLRQNTVSYFK